MQDYRGSPSSERIYQRESSREGETFDDSNLINNYTRTIHDYEFVDGELRYQNCRYDHIPRPGVDERKKKFFPRRPRQPDELNRERDKLGKGHNFPNDEFVFGIDFRRVIYNWPSIAKFPLSPTFVCQGEKNANDLIKHKLQATTVICNDWTPECVGALTGYELFILEDHDDAGRKLAAKAQRLLGKVAKSTRVITMEYLWRHLPEKRQLYDSDDISDWLAAGGDPSKLVKICSEIPAEGVITAKPHKFVDERNIAPWDFLYGKHLLRGTVSLTAGSGETGKSTKSVTEALAMTADKSLLGVKPPNGPLRVLLVNLEDNRNAMDKRVAAAMRLHGLTPEDVGDRLITVARGELKLKVATQTRQGVIEPNEAAIKSLTEYLIEHKIDVLSIDPLRKTHQVNENDNVAMGEVVELYEDIAEDANCNIHIWHHMRKGNGGEVTVESIRGASTIVDAPRSCEVVEKMTKGEAERMNIEPDKRRLYFSSYNGKVNFAPPVEQRLWFKLESVDLENAFPGDQVGVVTMWQPPSASDVTLSPGDIEQIKAKVGSEPCWRENLQAAMWVGKAVAEVMKLNHKNDREVVKGLLWRLTKTGVLKTQMGRNAKREPTMFVVASQ
jgi:hypothetical protein